MIWGWLAAFGAGFAAGALLMFFVRRKSAYSAREIAKEIFHENEQHLRESFGSLSLDALRKSTEELEKLARANLTAQTEAGARELESKKELISGELKNLTGELDKVSQLVRELEKDRIEKFGELTQQLKATGEQTATLTQITHSLREALGSTKARGSWGERMAEDVLRLCGFLENVNYIKQKSINDNRSRPDFTFLLPRDLKLNMDVKFPFENFKRYVETDSESDRENYKNAFLKDVKNRIKEITSRDYINPVENTLDYVLLFIPNEQIYAFIQQEDHSLVECSLSQKVVLCSPLTLFAVLAVIRQAVDNFAFEKTSNEILSLLGSFKKQWVEFTAKMDKLGQRISDAQQEYEMLSTTRRRQLERPLNQIEELRTRRGISAAADEEELLTIDDKSGRRNVNAE